MTQTIKQFASSLINRLRSPINDDVATGNMLQDESDLKDTLKSFSPLIRQAMKEGEFSLRAALYNENDPNYELLTIIAQEVE